MYICMCVCTCTCIGLCVSICVCIAICSVLLYFITYQYEICYIILDVHAILWYVNFFMLGNHYVGT